MTDRDVPDDVTVWIAKVRQGGGGDRRLHLWPGCAALKSTEPDRIRDLDRGDRPANDLCPRCTGEWTPHAPEGDPGATAQSLLDTAPGDVDGLTPLAGDLEEGST